MLKACKQHRSGGIACVALVLVAMTVDSVRSARGQESTAALSRDERIAAHRLKIEAIKAKDNARRDAAASSAERVNADPGAMFSSQAKQLASGNDDQPVSEAQAARVAEHRAKISDILARERGKQMRIVWLNQLINNVLHEKPEMPVKTSLSRALDPSVFDSETSSVAMALRSVGVSESHVGKLRTINDAFWALRETVVDTTDTAVIKQIQSLATGQDELLTPELKMQVLQEYRSLFPPVDRSSLAPPPSTASQGER